MYKETLKELRIFKNQLILVTIIFFLGGGFLAMPFDFLSERSSEGAGILFGFGIILAILAISNTYSYTKYKKEYNKLNK